MHASAGFFDSIDRDRKYIIKMNLLDQLANFCPTPVSINILESSHRETREGPRTTRNHSVFAISNCDTRHSKSIDKLETWTPSNRQEQRKKIMFKLFGTLSKKARKIYFTFWVNCEQAIKNNKIQKSKHERGITACDKIIGFVSAYQAKQSQIMEVSKAFSKIVKYSNIHKVKQGLERAIQPPLVRLQQSAIKRMRQKENMHLKLDIFINSLQAFSCIWLKTQIMHIFKEKFSAQKVRTKKQQEQGTKLLVSKNIQIALNQLKNKQVNLNEQSPFLRTESVEPVMKLLGKMATDISVENCPDICDSNLLFIQQPIYPSNRNLNFTKTASSEGKLGLKSRKSGSKLQLQCTSQYLNTSKKQISLVEAHSGIRTRQSTPKCRSISSSSIFNVDQSRMDKLESKLFGSTIDAQSQYSVNGMDWKSDRKALEQIIYHIKSPQKIRRRSAYEIQANQLCGKMQFYQGRATKQNLKPKELNFDDSHSQLKEVKSSIMKSVINNSKAEQKILISLKSKRRECQAGIEMPPQTIHVQKLYEQSRSGKKLYSGSRK